MLLRPSPKGSPALSMTVLGLPESGEQPAQLDTQACVFRQEAGQGSVQRGVAGASGEGDPSRRGADWERLVEGRVSGIQGGWAGGSQAAAAGLALRLGARSPSGLCAPGRAPGGGVPSTPADLGQVSRRRGNWLAWSRAGGPGGSGRGLHNPYPVSD